MTPTTYSRPALGALYVGLVLTVAATAAPFVDRATGNLLADHIRSGYPTYSDARVDDAVTAWLAILAVVGVLGAISWLGSIWAVRAGKSYARWVASAMFVAGTSVALSAALTKDTSGEVGLAPELGLIGIAPCLVGLVAVAMLWRSRPH